jgi:hypothetical protein
MRIAFTITDDSGKVFQGQADLTPAPTQRSARNKSGATRPQSAPAPTVNFSSPARAFVKNHARGMGGPQKFTLLVAHMSKGDEKTETRLKMIEKQWSKMTALLGKWNRAHPTRAKEHEWVDSPKNGTYVLLPGWRGIFNA